MTVWVHLSTRWGDTIENPTEMYLRNALQELFNNEDEEHPDAWVDCGTDTGIFEVLTIYESGFLIYEKFSNQDMTEELEKIEIDNVCEESALDVWKIFIASCIAEDRKELDKIFVKLSKPKPTKGCSFWRSLWWFK